MAASAAERRLLAERRAEGRRRQQQRASSMPTAVDRVPPMRAVARVAPAMSRGRALSVPLSGQVEPVETGDLIWTRAGVGLGAAGWGTEQPSGGSGSVVVRKFEIAYNTPSITAGHALFTPTAGDVLLDLWVSIHTAWNGTTPFGDVGTAAGGAGSTGAFGAMMGPLDMTRADNPTSGPFGPRAINVADFRTNQAVSMGTSFNSGLYQVSGADVNLIANATGSGESEVPALFSGDPVLVWVNQEGTSEGTDPVASQGSATIYMVTASPT